MKDVETCRKSGHGLAEICWVHVAPKAPGVPHQGCQHPGSLPQAAADDGLPPGPKFSTSTSTPHHHHQHHHLLPPLLIISITLATCHFSSKSGQAPSDTLHCPAQRQGTKALARPIQTQWFTGQCNNLHGISCGTLGCRMSQMCTWSLLIHRIYRHRRPLEGNVNRTRFCGASGSGDVPHSSTMTCRSSIFSFESWKTESFGAGTTDTVLIQGEHRALTFKRLAALPLWPQIVRVSICFDPPLAQSSLPRPAPFASSLTSFYLAMPWCAMEKWTIGIFPTFLRTLWI